MGGVTPPHPPGSPPLIIVDHILAKLDYWGMMDCERCWGLHLLDAWIINSCQFSLLIVSHLKNLLCKVWPNWPTLFANMSNLTCSPTMLPNLATMLANKFRSKNVRGMFVHAQDIFENICCSIECCLKAFSYEVGYPTQVRSHLQC